MDSQLQAAVREIELHVSQAGWDQAPRLFALVPTAELVASGAFTEATTAAELTSVEQDISIVDVEELLGTLAWPAEVTGAVLVVERIVLPPEVHLPEDESIAETAANHPQRQDVRLVAAALRTGETLNAIRYRAHDHPADVAFADDIVPTLNTALAATFD